MDYQEWVAARLPALLRYAHLLTGDPHRAEDVVQVALAKTLLKWSRIDRNGNPEGYVRKAILNQVINTQRRRWRERPTEVLPETPVPAPAPEERLTMWSALATLPPKQRAVVVLRYYDDLSEAQIAETLGCSTGTVKSQASKALAKLRTHFETVEVAR